MASFNKIIVEGVRSAPDRVYYNGTVINNTQTSNQNVDDPNIVFQDQRQTDLIPDSANYEVSVENYALNGVTNTLPLFIPQIEPPEVINAITGVSATPLVNDPTVTQALCSVTFTLTDPVTLLAGNVVDSVSGFPAQYGYLNTGNLVVTSATSTSFTVLLSVPVPFPVIGGGSFASTQASYKDPLDITTTIYSVSVGIYNGSTYEISTKHVVWQPENSVNYISIPQTANPVQEESSYYYSYNYSHWISLVNKALLEAWTEAVAGGTCGTQCPFFEYDPTTSLFSLNQDSQTSIVPVGVALPAPYGVSATVTTSASGGTYQTGEYSFVGVNYALEPLLSNFDYTYFSGDALWASQAGVFLPEVVLNTGLLIDLETGVPATDLTPVGLGLKTQPKTSLFQLVNPFLGTPIPYAFFLRCVQDFSSTGINWSPVASLVLVTTQIPVRNEGTANPIVLGTSNNGASTSGAFQRVLIETPIDAVKADLWRGYIFYEPRTLTFSSLEPSNVGISNIDVSVFWRNRLTNSLVALKIPNQGSMTFRLLFKKKYIV